MTLTPTITPTLTLTLTPNPYPYPQINFVATAFMATNRKATNRSLDFNTRFLIVVALLSGLLGTLPSLVLFDGLPCSCSTEDCFDTSPVCDLNRLNVPLLHTIMFALAVKMRKLHSTVKGSGGGGMAQDGVVGEVACVLLASLLFGISLGLEDRTYGSDQYSLHVSRSAFLCKMRLPSYQAEFLLMYLPVMVAGMVVLVYLTRVIGIVVATVKRAVGSKVEVGGGSGKQPTGKVVVAAEEDGSQKPPKGGARIRVLQNKIVFSTSLLCVFALAVLLLWSVSSILSAPQFASAQSDFDLWFNRCYKVLHRSYASCVHFQV
jgi:hypothetical protein